MEKKFQHIILDLDGTLIEETGSLLAQVDAVAQVFGDSREAKQKIIYAFFAANDRAVREGGMHKNDILQYMLWMGEELGAAVSADEASSLAAAWQEAYQNASKAPVLFPDTIDLLEGLKERGYAPILASGGGEAEKQSRLEAAGIEMYFSRVFAAEDIGWQKQDRCFWEILLEQIRAKPESVLVIGNQINDDIMCPQSLGMTTVLIKRPGVFKKVADPQGVTPSYVVSDLCGVLNLV